MVEAAMTKCGGGCGDDMDSDSDGGGGMVMVARMYFLK